MILESNALKVYENVFSAIACLAFAFDFVSMTNDQTWDHDGLVEWYE